MSIRDDLVGKLSDCMDPDNAAAFVAEAINEALTAERQAREQAKRERDAAVDRWAKTRTGQLARIALARAEQAEQERDRLREALRRLMKESAAVMALAEPQLRDTIGHTNVSVFRLRVEEAGAALSPQDGPP